MLNVESLQLFVSNKKMCRDVYGPKFNLDLLEEGIKVSWWEVFIVNSVDVQFAMCRPPTQSTVGRMST